MDDEQLKVKQALVAEASLADIELKCESPGSAPDKDNNLNTGTEGAVKVSPDANRLAPGTLFDDKYEIIQVLGEGGMSIVYKARHLLLNNLVAIKVLKGRYATDSSTIQRFQREGQAVSRLDNPHIVRVSDFGLAKTGQPFLAIEYLQGEALSEVISHAGPLPLEKAIHIYKQISEALAAAHAAGVIHRDLKPSNVIVLNPENRLPTIKIVDFGIAKIFDEEEVGQNKLTQTGDIFGSPLYMSPEQCLGQKMDDRSDIYSMGCLMYEGLTGVPPLDGENVFQTFKKQVGEMPRTFREVVPLIKNLSEIEPVVFKCLAKDAGHRYQTMAQLNRALEQLEGGGSAGGALAGNIKTMAMLKREELKSFSWRRVVAMSLIIVGLGSAFGMFVARSSQVQIETGSPEAQACFALDKGNYKVAGPQFANMLSEAKRNNLKESVVRFLGDEATMQRILGNTGAEKSDDDERNQLIARGGDRSAAEESTMQLIDVLIGSGKKGPALETALSSPVAKIIDIAQDSAWGQDYGPAADRMEQLIAKVSPALGPDSALIAHIKAEYASILLQKIINPLVPFQPGERQLVIDKTTELLQAPLKLKSGDDLILSQANMALVMALKGDKEQTTILFALLEKAYTSGAISHNNVPVLLSRMADIEAARNNYLAAIKSYKIAYRIFLAGREYTKAAYCFNGLDQSTWLEGRFSIQNLYQFMDEELKKAETSAPEAVPVRAALQAGMGRMKTWIGVSDPQTMITFFKTTMVDGKSQNDHRLEAERLFLQSLVSLQNSRPSELWLSGSALDQLIMLYANGDNTYRSIPLMRLKLAVAERTNNSKARDEATHALARALMVFENSPLQKLYAAFEPGELTFGKQSPDQEAKNLFEKSFHNLTAGGAGAILWLDEWFPDLATRYATNPQDKAKLLASLNSSVENVGKVYGSDSLEYLIQLRWYARCAWHLNDRPLALKISLRAVDVARANDILPLMQRRNIFFDYAYLLEWTGDKKGAEQIVKEMNSLSQNKNAVARRKSP